MTREEIIDELCRLRSDITNAGGYVNRTDAQKNRFAQALSEEIQKLQTEPCEDCISRTAVLAGLANIAKDKAKSDAQKAMMGRSMFFIERLPSIQPTQKTGKWIKKMVRGREELYCSNCGDGIDVIYEYNYCPTCGAKMEEGE